MDDAASKLPRFQRSSVVAPLEVRVEDGLQVVPADGLQLRPSSGLQVKSSDSPCVIYDDGPEVYYATPPTLHHAMSEEKMTPLVDLSSTASSPVDQIKAFGNAPEAWTGKRCDERVCGLRRGIFWTLVGLFVFLVLLCLGVGVGVGVYLNQPPGSAEPPSSDEPLTSTSIFIELQVSTIFTSEPTLQTTNTLASSTSRPTSSITPTTIETASSPSTTSQTRSEQSSMIIQTTLLTEIATSSERRPETTSTTTRPARTTTSSTSINTAPWAAATFSPSARACPEIHNTLYRAKGSNRIFWRRCGIDYGGEGEADVFGEGTFRSLQDCVDFCASLDGCEGASWGPHSDDPDQTCYLKTNLVRFHVTTIPEWSFAMLIPED
ncbi:hypothetical protein S40285_10566 [Stachybotrys chlorohalonatus IBT 40285]|uniref:Apple domain-containing protein n=1 Tax=Stachybotrys chlorohalonatus (strain IBT 40285) TaxID=1283841 RepID=A0A084Q7N5_STAC4|nr:hypothetical protein S40285_10566 [Stachybotrys chlorohalonata IBT 40285]